MTVCLFIDVFSSYDIVNLHDCISHIDIIIILSSRRGGAEGEGGGNV